MRRRLLAVASAISLALCLAVVWTWHHPRSSGGVRRTIVEIPAGGSVMEVSELGDSLILGWLPGDHRQIEAQTPPAGMANQRSLWGLPGVIAVISVRIWNGERAVGVIARDWFLAGLSALLPVAWVFSWTVSAVRRWVQARRARLGWCVRCAYDLRGTPQRCPECGAVPERAPLSSQNRSPHDPPVQRTMPAV